MLQSETKNQCNVSNLITKKRYDNHDMTGKFVSQLNVTPAVEAKYFQWRKERYDGLAVGRKRDNGWWNALDSQKHWQHWLNEEINEIIILPTPSRSFLEKLYNRLSNEADSPIGFAKRGLSVLLRARNTRIQIKRRIYFFCTFCSCAVGGRADSFEAPEKSP